MSKLPQNHKATAGRKLTSARDRLVVPPESRPKGRSLLPHGGNDRMYTLDLLARDIVNHFRPTGKILEPAAGGGAFLRALRGCDWCEIDKRVNFFKCQRHYDWIITNPPYSLSTEFLRESLELADNIVFLCPINSWFQRARERAISEAGFAIVETCRIPVPPPPWPQFGLSLGATWVRRGWLGRMSNTRLPSQLWPVNAGDKMVVQQEVRP
jgi:hypothetical protein